MTGKSNDRLFSFLQARGTIIFIKNKEDAQMKVVMINGQNHKGSTWHIGRMLAEKLTVPEDITEFFLPRDMPHFCLGCTQCFMKSETLCPHAAQLAPITAAMDAADVLIFTSPVYVYHATGSMKAFLDHYGWRWMPHRPEAKMFTKQGVVISTAAGGGMKSTNRDIADSLFFWGVPRVYKYGLAVRAISWEEVNEKRRANAERWTDRTAAKIRARAGHVQPGLRGRAVFSFMRFLIQKMQNPADYEYWQQKGWFGSARPWKE